MTLLPATQEKLSTEEYFMLGHIRGAISACFRTALGIVDVSLRQQVVGRFATIIRAESGGTIDQYGELFFRARDLNDLSVPDRALVKDHLFGRMKTGLTQALLEMLEGIGAHLEKRDAARYIDPFARAVTRQRGGIPLSTAVGFLERQSAVTNGEVDEAVRKRLEEWKRVVAEKNDESDIRAVDSLIAAAEGFPF
jgi:hypothetical protein